MQNAKFLALELAKPLKKRLLSFFFLFLFSELDQSHEDWLEELARQKVDPTLVNFAKQLKGNQNCCGSVLEPEPNIAPSSQDVLYIFMSFSVPKQVWLDLYEQIGKHPFRFVVRGLPDNSFKKLAEKVKEYACPVDINPDLFDKYGITAVPTFVLVSKKKGYKRVFGNVSLNHALEVLKSMVYSKDKSSATT